MVERVTVILGFCSTGVFLGLATIGVRRVLRGSAADRWLAGCFASLAAVLLASLVLPEKAPDWVGKVTICVLLLFPYLLYRFTSSFHASDRRLHAVALAGFAVVAGVSLFLPSLSETGGQGRPAWLQAYLVLFLVYWCGLSTIVVARLSRSGRGHPTLTRRRMRLMSIAAAGLTMGVLIASAAPQGSATFELVLQLFVLATGIAFLLGFSPPRTLRLAWRTPEQEAARAAVSELMRAETATNVARVLKPDRLTAEEFEVVKTHTVIGARILSGSHSPLLQLGEIIAGSHHERWDGRGYHGLAGEDIPLHARITTLADAFDAMTTDRPYRAARSREEATEEIRRERGGQFDPNVVDVFLDLGIDSVRHASSVVDGQL